MKAVDEGETRAEAGNLLIFPASRGTPEVYLPTSAHDGNLHWRHPDFCMVLSRAGLVPPQRPSRIR